MVKATDSSEGGMNPVAMTIISPQKEYWPSRGSNKQPPVLKSVTLPTELWGSAQIHSERNEFIREIVSENSDILMSSVQVIVYHSRGNKLYLIV